MDFANFKMFLDFIIILQNAELCKKKVFRSRMQFWPIFYPNGLSGRRSREFLQFLSGYGLVTIPGLIRISIMHFRGLVTDGLFFY